MAESTLTVRTLGLAVVALVLACGKAAMGDGTRVSRPPTYTPGSGGSPARAAAPSAGSSGGSGVATFTSRGGGSAAVKTVTGQRAGGWNPRTVTSAKTGSKPAVPMRKTAGAHGENSITVRHVVIGGLAGQPAVAVKAAQARKASDPGEWALAAREAAKGQPVVLAALATPARAPALTRNAFAVSGEPTRADPVPPRPSPGRASLDLSRFMPQ